MPEESNELNEPTSTTTTNVELNEPTSTTTTNDGRDDFANQARERQAEAQNTSEGITDILRKILAQFNTNQNNTDTPSASNIPNSFKEWWNKRNKATKIILIIIGVIIFLDIMSTCMGGSDQLHGLTRPCDKDSCFELGAQHYNRGETRTAALYYQKACNKDSDLGCLNLALLYATGDGVPKDRKKALKLSKKACDLGNSLGCMEYRNVIENR